MAILPTLPPVESDAVLGVVVGVSGVVFYLMLVLIVLLQLDIMDLPLP